jgi:N-acetylglucosaminyldiphosphoundecaprenol N-acetyl-beta-D-mannosaminyltransferase
MEIPCLERRPKAAFLRTVHLLRVRAVDTIGMFTARAFAAGLLLILLPVIGAALFAGKHIARYARVGRRGSRIECYGLFNRGGERCGITGNLPLLWSIVTGDLDWVGPSARNIGELDLRAEDQRRILSVPPGVVCTWWIRTRTNIAYGTQKETDLDFVEKRSYREKVGILARAGLAAFYGGSRGEFPMIANILGLPIDNLSLDQAVDQIVCPVKGPRSRQVSFLNVDCVNKAITDLEYRRVLVNSELRLADGIGLRIGGKLLRSEIRENVNGTDLFPRLCARMAQEGLSVYLLGGRPGVPEEVAAWIHWRYPGLRVAGHRHGYFQPTEETAILADILQSGADILLVGLGAPLQEKWIHRNGERLRVRSAIGVGGLFDFYSGRIPRAPQWLRELGLEWTYRLCQEPGRMWRRYLLGNIRFLARVLVARTRKSFERKLETPQVSQ